MSLIIFEKPHLELFICPSMLNIMAKFLFKWLPQMLDDDDTGAGQETVGWDMFFIQLWVKGGARKASYRTDRLGIEIMPCSISLQTHCNDYWRAYSSTETFSPGPRQVIPLSHVRISVQEAIRGNKPHDSVHDIPKRWTNIRRAFQIRGKDDLHWWVNAPLLEPFLDVCQSASLICILQNLSHNRVVQFFGSDIAVFLH